MKSEQLNSEWRPAAHLSSSAPTDSTTGSFLFLQVFHCIKYEISYMLLNIYYGANVFSFLSFLHMWY